MNHLFVDPTQAPQKRWRGIGFDDNDNDDDNDGKDKDKDKDGIEASRLVD